MVHYYFTTPCPRGRGRGTAVPAWKMQGVGNTATAAIDSQPHIPDQPDPEEEKKQSALEELFAERNVPSDELLAGSKHGKHRGGGHGQNRKSRDHKEQNDRSRSPRQWEKGNQQEEKSWHKQSWDEENEDWSNSKWSNNKWGNDRNNKWKRWEDSGDRSSSSWQGGGWKKWKEKEETVAEEEQHEGQEEDAGYEQDWKRHRTGESSVPKAFNRMPSGRPQPPKHPPPQTATTQARAQQIVPWQPAGAQSPAPPAPQTASRSVLLQPAFPRRDAQPKARPKGVQVLPPPNPPKSFRFLPQTDREAAHTPAIVAPPSAKYGEQRARNSRTFPPPPLPRKNREPSGGLALMAPTTSKQPAHRASWNSADGGLDPGPGFDQSQPSEGHAMPMDQRESWDVEAPPSLIRPPQVKAPPARGELQNAPDEVYEGYDYEGYERSHEAPVQQTRLPLIKAPPAQGELQNAPHEGGYEGYDYEGYERSHEAPPQMRAPPMKGELQNAPHEYEGYGYQGHESYHQAWPPSRASAQVWVGNRVQRCR
eukprot:s4605_g4.t2